MEEAGLEMTEEHPQNSMTSSPVGYVNKAKPRRTPFEDIAQALTVFRADTQL